MGLFLDGQTYFVPGVFAVTKVVNDQGAAMPAFNVGVIIAKQQKGIPYTAGIGTSPAMTADEFILPFADGASLSQYCGDSGDDEILTQFQYAKKKGAGTVFVLPANPFTQTVAVIKDKTTPTKQMTLTSVDYGAHTADSQITIASGVHTIVPPKLISYLTADAGVSGTILTVKNAGKYQIGQTLYVTDNAYTAPLETTIDDLDLANNRITIHNALATAVATSRYARVFELDPVNQTVSGAITTNAQLLNFYGANQYYGASAAVSGVVPANTDAVFVGYVAGATKGTSPAASAGDWQAIADNFLRWNEEFAIVNKIYLRYVLLGTSDAANHASFAALATETETVNKPIVCVGGCALGDWLLATSDSSNPLTRAFDLNSDRFELAGFGLDGLDAYLSYAPEVFGDHLGNPVNHNLTRDDIVAQSVEKAFFKDDASYPKYNTGGVLAIEMTKTGYKMSMGVNTYQDQSSTFNQDTKKTYLIANRNVADFDLRATIEILDPLAGADGVTAEMLTSALLASGAVLRDQYQYILDFSIDSLTKTGNAWVVKRTVTIGNPTDQIGLINTIYVQS